MSERGIAPVAGDDAGFDLDGFGRLHSVAVLRKKGNAGAAPLAARPGWGGAAS
jgi:hypothetical protein